MKPSLALTTLLAFSTCTSAWPWPPAQPGANNLLPLAQNLNRRQQNNGGNNNPPPTNGKGPITDPPKTDAPTKPTDKPSADSGSQSDNESDDKPAPTGAKGDKSSTDDSKETDTKEEPIPTFAAQGGISMLEPPLTSGAQFYRVGTTVTFVWNYTSLYRTPAQIDVLATIGFNTLGGAAATPYTISTNMSFQETQTIKWDTGAFFAKTPLPVASYTLLVYDANAPGGYTQAPKAGHLGVYNQFYFGMYTPDPLYPLATPLQCVTCNAAGGKMERLTLGFLTAMVGLMTATFVWVGMGNGIF